MDKETATQRSNFAKGILLIRDHQNSDWATGLQGLKLHHPALRCVKKSSWANGDYSVHVKLSILQLNIIKSFRQIALVIKFNL